MAVNLYEKSVHGSFQKQYELNIGNINEVLYEQRNITLEWIVTNKATRQDLDSLLVVIRFQQMLETSYRVLKDSENGIFIQPRRQKKRGKIQVTSTWPNIFKEKDVKQMVHHHWKNGFWKFNELSHIVVWTGKAASAYILHVFSFPNSPPNIFTANYISLCLSSEFFFIATSQNS